MYHSKQTYTTVINGKRYIKTKTVTISRNRGTKRITLRDPNGRTRTSKKSLTKKEMQCIKRCQFIPNLFQDCESCI